MLCLVLHSWQWWISKKITKYNARDAHLKTIIPPTKTNILPSVQYHQYTKCKIFHNGKIINKTFYTGKIIINTLLNTGKIIKIQY
jgi:ArsR family metal-binding transcriptional regulator